MWSTSDYLDHCSFCHGELEDTHTYFVLKNEISSLFQFQRKSYNFSHFPFVRKQPPSFSFSGHIKLSGHTD